MENETVVVMVDDKEVAKALFTFDDTQILVSNVNTDDKYQKCGYGRLLFAALKCIAQQSKLPLLLDSLDDAVPFYEKVGMLHLNDPEVQKLVILGNVRKEKIEENIDNDDFVWIPKGIRRKPTINL